MTLRSGFLAVWLLLLPAVASGHDLLIHIQNNSTSVAGLKKALASIPGMAQVTETVGFSADAERADPLAVRLSANRQSGFLRSVDCTTFGPVSISAFRRSDQGAAFFPNQLAAEPLAPSSERRLHCLLVWQGLPGAVEEMAEQAARWTRGELGPFRSPDPGEGFSGQIATRPDLRNAGKIWALYLNTVVTDDAGLVTLNLLIDLPERLS